LTYDFKLDEHRFNVLVGQEATSYASHENYIYATGFGVDLEPEKIFSNLGLGSGTTSISSTDDPLENFASFFGRVNYNYLDKYLLTLTAREDGSSKFKPGPNQWGFFPAAAAAWRISEEDFMRGLDDITNLKLRFGYGEAGNVRIGNTLYKLDYSIKSSKTYGVGDVANNYYSATNSQLPNPDLKWETTITRNLGLDFGLWKDRLTGVVDVYWNTTKDLLLASSIVAPGYTTQYQNVGQTSNKGVEFSFNTYIVERKNFTLSANFNIGFNRSNVDELSNGVEYQEYSSGWAGTDMKGVYDFRVAVG
jgi:outer membrane receptor protein involved in Fe transport